jgi:hypothetical protein
MTKLLERPKVAKHSRIITFVEDGVHANRTAFVECRRMNWAISGLFSRTLMVSQVEMQLEM